VPTERGVEGRTMRNAIIAFAIIEAIALAALIFYLLNK